MWRITEVDVAIVSTRVQSLVGGSFIAEATDTIESPVRAIAITGD